MSHLKSALKTTIKQPNSLYSMILAGLNKQSIIDKLQFYGFVECARMVRFLSLVVDSDALDTPSFKYLLAVIDECIEKHTKGYTDYNSLTYFDDLVKLRDEIEYITSICYE